MHSEALAICPASSPCLRWLEGESHTARPAHSKKGRPSASPLKHFLQRPCRFFLFVMAHRLEYATQSPSGGIIDAEHHDTAGGDHLVFKTIIQPRQAMPFPECCRCFGKSSGYGARCCCCPAYRRTSRPGCMHDSRALSLLSLWLPGGRCRCCRSGGSESFESTPELSLLASVLSSCRNCYCWCDRWMSFVLLVQCECTGRAIPWFFLFDQWFSFFLEARS